MQTNLFQPRFDGADYKPARDDIRLRPQLERVKIALKSGQWLTLAQLAYLAEAPEPSVSAQIRHLRKERFGSHTVEREHLGNGLYRYRCRTLK